MKTTCILFAVIAAAALSNSFRLEDPVFIGGGTDYGLRYDDGSSYWLTWDGLYRGVWFDTQDFLPGSQGIDCGNTEYWFYHHAERPWDTSDFYAELWNGASSAPISQLNQTTVTAYHYSGVFADYSPIIRTERNFWVIVNTEMSSGGWPALLGDNTPNTTDHSFFSDDFIVWEPWIMTGSVAGDYFIMAGWGHGALESGSWGTIKDLYRGRS